MSIAHTVWIKRLTGLIVILALTVLGRTSARAFEKDFHFYAVYYLLRAKGYPTNQAYNLGGFSQYVDDNSATEPLFCTYSKRAKFHFAGSQPDLATVRYCEEAKVVFTNAWLVYSAGAPEGKYVAGAALHLMADTFSHQTFTAWWNSAINRRIGSVRPNIGHADTEESGHYPDRPYNDRTNALAAALAIYQIVPAYPGGVVLPPTKMVADLDPAFVLPAGGKEDRTAIEVRVKAMKTIIRATFGEDVNYDKNTFAKEKDAFLKAAKP